MRASERICLHLAARRRYRWLSREHTYRELSLDIQLVEDPRNGQLVGWAYFRPNGEFNFFACPEVATADDGSLLDALLDFVDHAWRATIVAGDPPVTLNTYCIDPSRSSFDRALAAALPQRGFVSDGSGSSATLMGSLEQVPEPSLPAGYHFDWVRTPALRVGRVEAHRGRTHPDHQRRGLARAVCLDACRALHAGGARRRQVGFNTEAGFATYTSLGFTSSGPDLIFTKDWRALQ